MYREDTHEQVIEGLHNGDTIQDLLQEKDMTLFTAIATCQAQDAAKKNCGDINRYILDNVRALNSTRYDHDGANIILVVVGSVPHTGKCDSCVRRPVNIPKSAMGGSNTGHSQPHHLKRGGCQGCGHPP